MCAEMVVIHKAVGAQQFAAQLIGRGFLRGGVLDIVSHRISRCIPINFFIQIVGTIRTPQDSGKKLDILQRVFCRKSARFILLIVYSLNYLCFFSSQEGGIFLNRFTGKCAEATAAHDLCTAIFVCLLPQRPDSQIDCRQAVLPWPNPPHFKRWPHLRKSHSRIVKTIKEQAGSGSRHCLPVQKNQLLSASEREREAGGAACSFSLFPLFPLQNSVIHDQSSKHDGHHAQQLDEDVDGRTRSVLEGIAHGVAHHAGLVAITALAA